jgi:opacity protein-like surface antigen
VTGNYDALGTFTVAQSFSQDWMATVRGRLGLDLGAIDPYLTAGLAISEIELEGSFSDTYSVVAQRIPLQSASSSETATGFVWGAGVEWEMFGGAARIEYLHADLGSLDYSRVLQQTNLTNVDTLAGTADVETDVIRVGYAWSLF